MTKNIRNSHFKSLVFGELTVRNFPNFKHLPNGINAPAQNVTTHMHNA